MVGGDTELVEKLGGEQTRWNPSNGPGRLFVDMVKALEPGRLAAEHSAAMAW